jgi:hypothetical protein
MERRKKVAVLLCLLLVSSMVATTAAASAKKPEKPPPEPEPVPTGTLYVMYTVDGTNWVWTMDPDGNNKAQDHKWAGYYMRMSHDQHGGNWWYVGFKPEGSSTYPDGEPRWEVFAVRGDGQKSVRLTNDADWEHMYLSCRPCWGHDDSYISWSAVVWEKDASGNDVVKEAGIYKASVTWDSNGDVTGIGTISTVLSTGYTSYNDQYYHSLAREQMDWSSDGKKFVYMLEDTSTSTINVHLYDTEASSSTEVVAGWGPRLSPDGNYIAYGKSQGLYMIKVDGTGETQLVEASNKGNIKGRCRDWDWSPDSKFLSLRYYTVNSKKPGQGDSDVYVVDLNGAKDCVTSSWSGESGKWNVGWR